MLLINLLAIINFIKWQFAKYIQNYIYYAYFPLYEIILEFLAGKGINVVEDVYNRIHIRYWKTPSLNQSFRFIISSVKFSFNFTASSIKLTLRSKTSSLLILFLSKQLRQDSMLDISKLSCQSWQYSLCFKAKGFKD